MVASLFSALLFILNRDDLMVMAMDGLMIMMHSPMLTQNGMIVMETALVTILTPFQKMPANGVTKIVMVMATIQTHFQLM